MEPAVTVQELVLSQCAPYGSALRRLSCDVCRSVAVIAGDIHIGGHSTMSVTVRILQQITSCAPIALKEYSSCSASNPLQALANIMLIVIHGGLQVPHEEEDHEYVIHQLTCSAVSGAFYEREVRLDTQRIPPGYRRRCL
jgi:hypothetical protein